MKAHARLLKLGLDTNPVTVTQLLQAYASQPCLSSLASARQLFDQFPCSSRDAFLWAAMISAYARSSLPVVAIRLLFDLLRLPSPPAPLSFAFASSARAAATVGDPLLARSLHAQVTRRHILPNLVVGTSLVDMYSKCISLGSARKVFDGMPHKNVVTWNSIIAAYSSGGMDTSALELFYRLKCVEPDLEADEFAVASAMSACAALNDLRSGMQIHAYSVTAGLDMDPAVANTTIKMYFWCRDVGSAERAFDGTDVSFHSEILMIKGYFFNEKYADAMKVLCQADGFVGLFMEDRSIALSVLSAAANLGLLSLGRQVHGIILTVWYCDGPISMENDAVLDSALIDMYCRCAGMSEAWLVFSSLKERDPSHWNALMSGCIYNGLLQEARHLFDQMPFRNVISWTSMISGYVQHGSPRKGLEILSRLYNGEGLVRGNSFTFATALDACSSLAALDAGKQIHAQVLRTSDTDGHQNVVVQTALVDMYSRSGNLGYARKIFDKIQNMNLFSWTCMITGYATHGFASEAIRLFGNMVRKGFVPNEVTFVSVLSLCSRCGLIEQGMQFLDLMGKYGIGPRSDHYACLVDMLGRAGELAEARNILESINGSETKSNKECRSGGGDTAAMWGALLGGCKVHGNVEIGSEVAREMISRRHQASGSVVALSNLYASSGDWDAVYALREEWKRSHNFAAQKPGHSFA